MLNKQKVLKSIIFLLSWTKLSNQYAKNGLQGLPWWEGRGHRFEPWSGKIPILVVAPRKLRSLSCRGATKPVCHNY